MPPLRPLRYYLKRRLLVKKNRCTVLPPEVELSPRVFGTGLLFSVYCAGAIFAEKKHAMYQYDLYILQLSLMWEIMVRLAVFLSFLWYEYILIDDTMGVRQ